MRPVRQDEPSEINNRLTPVWVWGNPKRINACVGSKGCRFHSLCFFDFEINHSAITFRADVFFLFGNRLTYKLLSNRQLFHIIISENTNIAIMSNLIQMEKVIQVQLDREGEQFVEIPGEPPNILQPIHGHR